MSPECSTLAHPRQHRMTPRLIRSLLDEKWLRPTVLLCTQQARGPKQTCQNRTLPSPAVLCLDICENDPSFLQKPLEQGIVTLMSYVSPTQGDCD